MTAAEFMATAQQAGEIVEELLYQLYGHPVDFALLVNVDTLMAPVTNLQHCDGCLDRYEVMLRGALQQLALLRVQPDPDQKAH